MVTKIEIDHVKYLGDTLELIAGEKAGIAKPGAPFVIGEARPELVAVLCREGQRYVSALAPAALLDARPVPPEAAVDRPAAARRGRTSGATLRWRWRRSRRFPPRGALIPDAVERGFADAFIAGRLDRRGRYLFDVAHNPDGVRTLVTALDALRPPGPIHAMVAILGDKDWPEMLRTSTGRSHAAS